MRRLSLLLLTFLIACQEPVTDHSLAELLTDSPTIQGKKEYIESPYVTAGNRLYMVGHQDGSFPELGWHIEGEMGGIWVHPVKLADGFKVSIQDEEGQVSLDSAKSFHNYPMANMHDYGKVKGLHIERWQVVPDDLPGIAVQYRVVNEGNEEFDGYLSLSAYPDLRPTWLGEETGMIDEEDRVSYLEELAAWLAEDSGNPWFLIFGANRLAARSREVNTPYKGKGTGLVLSYELELDPGETELFTFVFSGSHESREEAFGTYQEIHANLQELVQAKIERYSQLASQARLEVPDEAIEETFQWLKYNADWLVREVPGIGNGIGAGIPDYPWWFGVDSEYALKGYMAVGQTEAVYQTIALLDSVSRRVNGNGRIIHEMSTNGKVFNPGNINETPQFASLVWEIFKWNGDKEFLENYYPGIKSGMDWLLNTQDKNGNLFPDGFGMMEIHGMDSEMIDVAVYTQRALEDVASMAELMNDRELARDYSEKARKLARKINTEFWSEEFGSYADFIGTGKQAIDLIEAAKVRADTLGKSWAVKELEQTRQKIVAEGNLDQERPFVVHHNWVVNTPMEMGIADSLKAIRALNTAERFVNPFGVYVTGIDGDEKAGTEEASFQGSKVFSYTGAVMTLPTGVQAIAENNYGRPDKALDYLKRMSRSFSYALPGSMYEVSPDYGMMTQAWNLYAFAVPIVRQFFGIQPLAHSKTIILDPSMPGSWDEGRLSKVPIGEQEITVHYRKTSGGKEYEVGLSEDGWSIQFQLPPNATYEVLQGETSEGRGAKGKYLLSTGKQLHIRLLE